MALLDIDRMTVIGRVSQPHGVQGEMKVFPLTDEPAYYTRCKQVYLDSAKGLHAFRVLSFRLVGNQWLLKLEGIADRNAAQDLQGAHLLLDDSKLRPLAPGEVFIHDLVGCQAQTLEGELLGTVIEVLDTGANRVLVIDRQGREVLLPLTAEVVQEMNMQARLVRVSPLPGLLELYDDPKAQS